MFVDSDDYLESYALKDLISNSNNEDFVISNNYVFSENESKKKVIFQVPKKDVIDALICNILNDRYSSKIYNCKIYSVRTVWGKLYKTNIVKNNNIKFNNEIKLFEDGLFNIEYISKIKTIKFEDRETYNYFISPVGTTNKYYPNRLSEDIIKINYLNSIDFLKDLKFKISLEIFKFNLFCAFIDKCLYHIESKDKSKYESISNVIESKYYDEFDLKIIHYLKTSKKIFFLLIKTKMYTIIDLIYRINRRRKK